MNTTIEFKTAKTIENMSRKIDGTERAVSGFFQQDERHCGAQVR